MTVPDERADATGSPPGTDSARRVVVIAFCSNLTVSVAFGVAAVMTGSISMFAQTVHAVADTANQALLFVAGRRSRSGPGLEQVEAGRAAYFWALLAAGGVFVIGGTLSIREGIRGLTDPEPLTDLGVAYLVLIVAMGLDGFSWLQAFRETRSGAARRQWSFFHHLSRSSDPTTRAVFGEDSAALIGDLLAMAGITLHILTGSAVFDAMASIAIGLVLCVVAVMLARRNLAFLLGSEPSTEDKDRVDALLRSVPGVRDLLEVLVTYVGPEQVWVIARIDVEDTLSANEVEEMVREADTLLRASFPGVVRVDLVPFPDDISSDDTSR
ncbi:MAG TPA: cation diffusion facilitator family transporter [Acidimicrobiales bacterium]